MQHLCRERCSENCRETRDFRDKGGCRLLPVFAFRSSDLKDSNGTARPRASRPTHFQSTETPTAIAAFKPMFLHETETLQ